jgi:bacillithiol system protein YtxJ
MAVNELERRAQVLRSPEEVEAFLAAHPNAAVFKAGSCHRTDRALDTLAPVLGPRGDLAVGLIRVAESRAASQRLADLTGIKHQSPQILLLRDGMTVFARDNWDISGESVEEALKTHFGPRDSGSSPAS